MSINAILSECVADGRLVEIKALIPGHRQRIVLAPPVVQRELDPHTAEDVEAGNAGELRAWIDGFTKGRRVTVGSDNNRHVDIKILNPQSDQVWELRKRASPSTRIFGRFAQKDLFVATNICTAHELFSLEWVTNGRVKWPIWKREIRKCKAMAIYVHNIPTCNGRKFG